MASAVVTASEAHPSRARLDPTRPARCRIPDTARAADGADGANRRGQDTAKHVVTADVGERGGAISWRDRRPVATALFRAEPVVFGHVGSDPTVSRLVDTLAADAPTALKVIDTARAVARARAWRHAGSAAPTHERSAQAPLVVDVDATLVTARTPA